eukprot:TRINITY_DN5937_c0_g1_i9.p1 TRINITY_DN5937_c0_g1~~TRINITY_DN5937_c0_g1_i9.p1  ORF type:complete len:253 (-),score=32.58 TRINITY_DN5937_c0_g1_i9:134-892(-)
MYLTLEGLGRKKNRYKNYPEGPDSGKREIQEPKTEVKFSEPGVSIDEQERLKVLPGDLITPTRKDLRFLTKSDGLHDAERPSLSKKGRSRTLSFSKDVLSKKSSTEKESDRTRISRSQSLNKNKEGSERHLKKDCTPSLVEPLEPKGTCMETRRRVFFELDKFCSSRCSRRFHGFQAQRTRYFFFKMEFFFVTWWKNYREGKCFDGILIPKMIYKKLTISKWPSIISLHFLGNSISISIQQRLFNNVMKSLS